MQLSTSSQPETTRGTRTLYSGWYVIVTGLFITCLVIANIIAVKIIALPGGYFVPAGIVIFPLSYLFGDVLTEVYGYAAARRTIWVGGLWPAAPFWAAQGAYNTILGFTPHLLIASFCAYLVGEFLNSFVLAKLKIATRGRWLWTRTIGSTFIGEGADSVVFILLAFGVTGVLSGSALVTAIVAQWAFKVLYEIVATPLTYAIVGFLKRQEGQDPFDTATNFSPIVLGRSA